MLRKMCVVMLAVMLSGCKSVTIPENDSIGPEVTLVLNVRGGSSASTVSGGAIELNALSTDTVWASAISTDDGGAEEILLKVVSGGKLKDSDDSASMTLRMVASESNPRDTLLVAGQIIPDPGAEIVKLRAFGKDYAGNETTSHEAILKLYTPAELSLDVTPRTLVEYGTVTANWLAAGSNLRELYLELPGEREQQVPVSGSKDKYLALSEDGQYNWFALRAKTYVPQEDDWEKVRVDISHRPEPYVQLNASPTSVCEGDTVTLKWRAENANKVVIDPIGHESEEMAGEVVAHPMQNISYTASAIGVDEAAEDDIRVSVENPEDTVVVSVPVKNNEYVNIDQQLQRRCADYHFITGVELVGTIPRSFTTGAGNASSIGVTLHDGPGGRQIAGANFYDDARSSDEFNGKDLMGKYWEFRAPSTNATLRVTVKH